ncbi:unnamed protein product [Orchesella dallaii]|uniref:Cilia- and flagella-associated protein 251 n=1 Tax=Orchesella dallaii TaxID=48710 RepID=A0ABP1RXN2_9HEXA
MDSMDPGGDRRVKFPGGKPSSQEEPAVEVVHSKQKADIILDDIHSDISNAPRLLKATTEVCHVKKEESYGSDIYNAQDYIKQRTQENQEFESNALSAVESLAPFKNEITSLAMDTEKRFFASADSGYKSLIIIWDILTGKALKFFPDPHDGKGCTTVTFTGVDYILASIGAEETGKQTVCLWDFDPNNQKKLPIVKGVFPQNVDLLRELTFDKNRPEFFAATGDKAVVFCTWLRSSDENSTDHTGDSIFCYKPKRRKNFMAKYKKFCHSLWMKEGKWLATSTMTGYICVWTPPMVLALEDPPDPKKNIRELARYFKLSEDGLTFFTIHKE